MTPILTVEETVRFARLCAEGNFDYTDQSIDAILRLLGLDHVKQTVVGNADVRGISGGQKRRVKVLEMAVGLNVGAMFMDEVTNGLDASTALSICKVIGVGLKAMQTTAMVSLLQPSTEVYETFQRLILLTQDGKVAYSGKREGALAHFESLGLVKPEGMNVPEFLLRSTYAPEEFQHHGSGSGEVPITRLKSSSDFVRAFQNSQAGKDLMKEIDDLKAKQKQTPPRELPDLPDFAISMGEQVRLLVRRGMALVVRNPATPMRAISAIIFGGKFIISRGMRRWNVLFLFRKIVYCYFSALSVDRSTNSSDAFRWNHLPCPVLLSNTRLLLLTNSTSHAISLHWNLVFKYTER